jgi:hypothetical protein
MLSHPLAMGVDLLAGRKKADSPRRSSIRRPQPGWGNWRTLKSARLLHFIYRTASSRGSELVTGWMVRGSHPCLGKKCILCFPERPRRIWGPPSPFFIGALGGGLIFLTIKRQRNSLTTTLSRTEFEGMWSSTSTPFTQPYGVYRDTVTYFTFAREFAVAWSCWRNLGGSR